MKRLVYPVGLASMAVSLAAIAPSQTCAWQPGNGVRGVGGGVFASALCAVEHHDGSGPSLFVGGEFTAAGRTAALNIARWDGNRWYDVGGGIFGGGVDGVEALAVFNGELYAGGNFHTAGGVSVENIARWNGNAWSNPGGGIEFGSVNAMVVYDGPPDRRRQVRRGRRRPRVEHRRLGRHELVIARLRHRR